MGLLDSFIKSAVNQVGRDAGKVVSNQVFKDAHSTPIRNVNSNINKHYVGNIENNKNVTRVKDNVFLWILGGMLLVLIPFIGFLVLLIYCIKKLTSKNSYYYEYKTRSIYKRDLRYSSGQKYIGEETYAEKIEIPILESTRTTNLIIGYSYLFFICLNLIFTLIAIS